MAEGDAFEEFFAIDLKLKDVLDAMIGDTLFVQNGLCNQIVLMSILKFAPH